MSKNRTIATSTMIVVMGYTAAKLLGFLRESVLAYFYGATSATDAYVIALSLRSFIILGIGGAVITSVIPVASSVDKKKGQTGVFKLISSLANSSIILSLFLVTVGSIAIRPAMGILAPGFDAQTLNLAIKLTLIMFPTAVLSLLQSVFNSLLQYRGDFSINATTDAINNVTTIGLVIIIGKHLGITAAAIGALVSSIAMMALQWYKLSALGYKHSWSIDVRDSAYRTVLLLIAPIVASIIVSHLGWMVIRSIGTGLVEGAVAFINYAQKLIMMPYFIIGTSIITVFYPTLSRKFHEEGLRSFLTSLHRSMSTVYFALMPIAAGAILIATPIVRIVYQRGAFTHEMTSATAAVLVCLAISIPFQALAELLSKAIFVMKDTFTPLWIMMVSSFISVTIAWILAPGLSYVGLAIGIAAHQVVAMLFSAIIFLRKLKTYSERISSEDAIGAEGAAYDIAVFLKGLAISLGKTTVATVSMSTAVILARKWLEAIFPIQGLVDAIILVGLLAAVGITTYAVSAYVLKSEELIFAFRLITSYGMKISNRMKLTNRI